MRVGFGGGEPLIRRDCVEILGVLSEYHVDTNITTNCWFLTDPVAEKLAGVKLGTVYASLDSASKEKHDSFRRKEGSYDRVIRGIQAAVAAGLTVKLSTVITTQNFSELDQIVDVAESTGVQGIEFKRFRPTGNGSISNNLLSLPQNQDVDVQPKLEILNKRSPLDIALFYNDEPDGGIDAGCPCGVRSLTLRPNGDVSPCAYAKTVIGNLVRDDLGSLWRDSPALGLMRNGASACAGLIPDESPSGEGFARVRISSGPSVSESGGR